jgi:exonuclease SbcC
VPGQNYVFGQNWQGKSSIVDAIGFALFGVDVFPKKIAGTPVKAEHLVNEDSAHGSVELRFEVDGVEYFLRRSLPSRDVSLRQGDLTIATGIRTVAEKLVSLLGVDVKLFQNIFFSDQDELRRSLDFSPEERRVFIERLLGVEEWKERIELLRAARRGLERLLEDLTAGRLGVFLSHVEGLDEELRLKREDIRELDLAIRSLKCNSPRNVQSLRQEERSSKNAVAVLQHDELRVKTRLEIEETLREGMKGGNCPTCTQPIPRPLRRSRLAELGRLIRELQRQLEKVRKDLAKQESSLSEEDFDASYETLLEVSNKQAQRRTIAEQLVRDEARLRKLRKQAKTFGRKPQQVEQTKSEIVFFETLEGVIQEFRKLLRGRLVRQLVVGTNDFVARFHDGDNDSQVKIDDDLNMAVQLHGREVPIFNLSGAAKDILALSLRYGLLRVAARGVNFLILDEPTRHMDTTNCQRLKSLFNDLLDRQLIVVTVNSEFSDAAGRHFRVLKDGSLHSVVAESW